jgi:hypothetical protein
MSDSLTAGPELEGLPDWARKALGETRAVPPRRPSALDSLNGPAWPLLLDAAVVAEFLPRDLGQGTTLSPPERLDAEKTVLGFAEIIQDPGGVRWSLTQEARTAVLDAALQAGQIDAAVSRTSSKFADPVSSALRDGLLGRTAAFPAAADLRSLEAIRVAVGCLSGVRGRLRLPKLEDLDREIDLRRLLFQFERMVGQVPGAGGSARPDRFFGREAEKEKLRGYVGVIAAETFAFAASRAVQEVARAIAGRKPMSVWGIGGVGKTTLIAKFMLEHAQVGASRFPFAYLDFDRATISARQRGGLLAEMCLQVGSQFPELTKPMADLRAKVRDLARPSVASPSGESFSLLASCAGQFRRHVDDYLDGDESFFERSRPFLLVFDTFEVVQYSPSDAQGLESFVLAFCQQGEKGLWPRLRLIIAGRKKVSDFCGEVEELPLGPLDPKGAAEMLSALANDAAKAITLKEARGLVDAIIKSVGGERKGVHPLRLRFVGEVFRQQATADGPAIVRSLRDELSRPPTQGGASGRLLVDGILVRRILGHVLDLRVRALADPGLVVRRITPAVIREVMTLGTPRPKPGGDELDPGDADPTEPWIVSQDEADDIFAAFRREVSLVEPDGDALRHRQDVRQEMLPLIRARRPKRFQALHRLAFDFFRTLDDPASAAEAIYHGLWLGEPLTALDRLWRGGSTFDPRLDPDELEAGSPASIYVRAKAKDRLQPREVAVLPREIAVGWLSDRRADLLTERRLNDALDAVRAAAGRGYEALDDRLDVAALTARLLCRAGCWVDSGTVIGRFLHPGAANDLAALGEREAAVSLARTWATLAAKGGAPVEELISLLLVQRFLSDPLSRVELLAHVAAGLMQRDPQNPQLKDLRAAVGDAARGVDRSLWSQEARILRLAALTGSGPMGDLLSLSLSASEQPPCDPELAPVIERVFSLLGRQPTGRQLVDLFETRDSSQEAASTLDELWRNEKRTLAQAVRDRPDLTADVRTLLAFQHFDWIRPFENSLARALDQDGNGQIRPALAEHGLLQPWPPQASSSQRRADGYAVVQWAFDRGRLLHLARALAPLGPNPPESERPQTIFGLSAALLRWHETMIRFAGLPADESQQLAV